MKELRTILAVRPVHIPQRFNEIAQALFSNFHIQKGAVRYDFLELEFYYYNQEHEDIITYPRTTQVGEWFIHSSGLDLSFESKMSYTSKGEIDYDRSYYGGVLLRCLLKTEQGKHTVINGPRKCLFELFNHSLNVFDDTFDRLPQVVLGGPKEKIDVHTTIRQIPNIEQKKKTYRLSDEEFKQLKQHNCYFRHSRFVPNNWVNTETKQTYSGTLPWKRLLKK